MKYIIFFLIGLWSCSYEPKDAGLCKLDCSRAIIAGNDPEMSIQLKTNPAEITCSVGNVDATPIIANFLIGETIATGGGTGIRPVPSLSFDPIVNGLRSVSNNNVVNAEPDPNNTETVKNFGKLRYIGIPTPSSEWCSDSCGVATIQVVPLCPPPGIKSEVSIQLHSGALYSDTVKFDVKTSDE